MKPLIAFLCIIFILTTAVQAQTQYVTDTIKVTMRTGPAMDRKIIAMLASGQPVEIIERGEEWSHVRISPEKDGWLLTRFIQSSLPCKDQLVQLQASYDVLTDNSGEPARELKRLNAENASLKNALSANRQELGALQSTHRKLMDDTADVRAIREQRDRLSRELGETRTRLAAVSADLDRARRKSNMWWFLIGAGVLLLGFIVGANMRSRKKRSSYY
jgi:SH3 domain protein